MIIIKNLALVLSVIVFCFGVLLWLKYKIDIKSRLFFAVAFVNSILDVLFWIIPNSSNLESNLLVFYEIMIPIQILFTIFLNKNALKITVFVISILLIFLILNAVHSFHLNMKFARLGSYLFFTTGLVLMSYIIKYIHKMNLISMLNFMILLLVIFEFLFSIVLNNFVHFGKYQWNFGMNLFALFLICLRLSFIFYYGKKIIRK